MTAPWEANDAVVAAPGGPAPWETADKVVAAPKTPVSTGQVAARAGSGLLNNAIAYTQAPIVGGLALADMVTRMFGGKGDLTTRYGDTFVQPNIDAVQRASLKPTEDAGPIGGPVLQAAPEFGKIVGDLAQGIPLAAAAKGIIAPATTVATKAIPAMVNALREGAVTGLPAGFRAAAEKQGALTEAGASPMESVLPAAITGLSTVGQFSLPASAGSAAATLPGRMGSRAAQGAAINADAGVVQRQLENLVLPDSAAKLRADPTDTASIIADAIGGAAFALPGQRNVRGGLPNREAMGYLPDPTLAQGATDFVPPERAPLPLDPNSAAKAVQDALFASEGTAQAPDLAIVPKDTDTPVSAPDPTKAPIAPDLTLEGDPAPAPPKRMTIADQVAQDDLAAATRRRVEADEAFTLAERRQQQADRDLRRQGQIDQDYQGDDAAYKASEPVRNITLLDGEMPVMVNGMVDGKADVTWQNADGSYSRAPVDPSRLTERQAPVNQRLAQDFQGRSSEMPEGVGAGTRAQERMPDRSTDRIAGDTSAGRADPYDPTINPREPRGDTTVMPPEGGPVVRAQPREGRTFDQPPPREVPPAPDNLLPDNGKRSLEGPGDGAPRLPGPDTPRPDGERFVVDRDGTARPDRETYGQDNARTEAARRAQMVDDYSRNDLGNTRRQNARPDNGPNDGGGNGERRPQTLDAESGRGQEPAARVGESARPDAAPDGAAGPGAVSSRTAANGPDAVSADPNVRNARVADPREVPRLQVEYEKISTQAKRVATRIRTLEKEAPSAARNDKLAKAKEQLERLRTARKDIADQLTPERLPKKESGGMTLMQALRKEGGVTPEMARDLGIDAKDPKTVNGKGLGSDQKILDALDKHGLLEDGDDYASVTKRIGDELRNQEGRTEGDLEQQARAQERDAMDAEAKALGIDTRDMTRAQIIEAIRKEEAKGATKAEQEAFEEAVAAAREEEANGRTIDDLLDEVGVSDKDIEDAKYKREAEVEGRAAADEPAGKGGGGEGDAPPVREAEVRQDEKRPDARPGGEQVDSGRGQGDGGAGEARPAAGEAGGKPPRPDEANYRLNALPFDAVFRGVKRMLGDGKQWKEYADWLHDVTAGLANQLKKPGEALTALKGSMRADSGENKAMAVIRLLNEDLGRRARIIVDKTDSATARKVLDMMDFELGRGEGTGKVFREDVQQKMGKSLNELATELQIVNDISQARQKAGMPRKEAYAKTWEDIITRLENPSLVRQGQIGQAVVALEKWLKGQRDMQVKSGVDLGDQGKTYFPVKYDADKVQADRAGFERDAAAAYRMEGASAEEAKAQAKALADGLIRGESFSLVGAETGAAASATKERVFTKTATLNTMRKWRNLDGRDVLISYANSAAKRAAIAERFGDNFGGRTDQQGKTITPSWKQLVSKITDEGGADALPILRQMIEVGTGVNQPRGQGANYADAMRNAMTMSALEKSVLPNLMETVTPLATTNGNVAAGLTMLRTNIHGALAGLGLLPKSERRAAAQSLLEGIGALSDIGSQQQAMARYSGSDASKGGFGEAVGKFFEGIGLNKLTDAQRISTADIGAVWFDSLAKAVTGDKGWKSLTKGADAKHLRDMGIPADKVQAFAEYVKGLNGKIPTSAELGKAGEMGALYGDAITRFMNSTVQHGDALTRPSWASTPWGSLVFQFSSYTYAFHKNVVRRAFNNAMDAGNLKNDLNTADRLSLATGMLPGFMLMGAVSYLTMELRDEVFNDLAGTKKKLTDQAKNERAVQNANLFGKYGRIFEQFGQQRYGTGAAGLFVPPAVAQGAKGIDALAQASREGSDKNTGERKIVKWTYNTILEPAWQIALSAGPGIPFGVASIAARTFAPSAAEAPFVDAVAGPAKKRAEKPIKGVFE